ncbi:hypothetical protein RD792_013813 [Penstemon davidsonii]|uniref:non-specific serine/threonine protein kinase n=1 Tax=Penstemon davidsonii TaxID=160366 RepID=A0ABR0CW26_9LAMI|nr:hypothetical protein RD792_013813 [Penstemon davidsonii]
MKMNLKWLTAVYCTKNFFIYGGSLASFLQLGGVGLTPPKLNQGLEEIKEIKHKLEEMEMEMKMKKGGVQLGELVCMFISSTDDPLTRLDRKKKSYNCSMDLPKNNVDEWDIEMGMGTCAEKDITEPVGSDSGPVIKYLLKDIDLATNGLTYDNLIWSGKTGKVFDGFLNDGSRVAVQNFSTSLGVKGFGEEAEAMCLIRHKNLVKIIGYCDEGIYRMLVYEHVENGNLNHWLHQNKEYPSPLSWNIRLHIIKGIANGLAYLHQDMKPAVVHPDLKSINILLDENWNPKITNFAMARLLSPAIAPSTRMHACSYHARRTRVVDHVYSFGILIMEIISGKTTTFSTTTVTEIEENLVHWIKCKFYKRKFGEILDPRLPEFPSQMEMIEQIVGIALECVDSEVHERPKMGKIIQTLEKSIEKIQTSPLSDAAGGLGLRSQATVGLGSSVPGRGGLGSENLGRRWPGIGEPRPTVAWVL